MLQSVFGKLDRRTISIRPCLRLFVPADDSKYESPALHIILCILAVLSTTAPNCLCEAYTFDIQIFFNDRGPEVLSGGKDTDMNRATVPLWT